MKTDDLERNYQNACENLKCIADLIKEGKKADIIMIDMNKPSMQPENNIVRNIVYSADNTCVKMTMIAGKILFEDGEYTTIDINETYNKCNELIKELA